MMKYSPSMYVMSLSDTRSDIKQQIRELYGEWSWHQTKEYEEH